MELRQLRDRGLKAVPCKVQAFGLNIPGFRSSEL